MNNGDKRYNEMIDALRGSGCRLTPQRLELVKLLSETHTHPSARQLYEEMAIQFPTTSLATVYKTLAVLKQLGQVTELGFSDDDNRYDAEGEQSHPHLICTECRKIVDAHEISTSDLAEQLAEASGYKITGQRIEFYGICPDCQRSREINLLSREAKTNTQS